MSCALSIEQNETRFGFFFFSFFKSDYRNCTSKPTIRLVCRQAPWVQFWFLGVWEQLPHRRTVPEKLVKNLFPARKHALTDKWPKGFGKFVCVNLTCTTSKFRPAATPVQSLLCSRLTHKGSLHSRRLYARCSSRFVFYWLLAYRVEQLFRKDDDLLVLYDD